jgi:hypothetical protein
MIWAGMLFSIPCFFLDLKEFRNSHRLVFIILTLVSAVEFYGKYLGLRGINNGWIYNIGAVYGETILILLFLSTAVNKKKGRFVIRSSAGSFFIYSIFYTIFFRPIDQFHNFSVTVASLLIIFGCFYYFFEIMFHDYYLEKQLWKIPDFWVATLLLLFFSSSFLFFAFFPKVIAMDAKLWGTLNLMLQLIGGTMYLSFGLVYYLPLLRQSNSNSLSTDLSSPSS